MEHKVENVGISEDSSMVRIDIDGTTHFIPGDYFPLSSEDTVVFEHINTKKLENNRIKKVFDKQIVQIGQCYSNTDNLYKFLVKTGVKKKQLKKYVGWVIIGNSLPIHHAWLVYQDKYLLDLTEYLDYQSLNTKIKDDDLDSVRELYVKEYLKFKKEKNSIKGIFGKAKEWLIYIGSECEPLVGLSHYNELIKEYPNHIITENVTDKGMTKTQSMIVERGYENENR